MAAGQEVISRIGRHPLSSIPRKDDLADVYFSSAEACFAIQKIEFPEPLEALVKAQWANKLPYRPKTLTPFGKRTGVV